MSIIRPENKQVVNPETGRLNLEWDAYFSRFEKILDYIGASQGDILYSGADQRPVVRASTDNGSTFNTGSYRNSSVNTYNSTVFTSPSTDSMISDIVTRASSSSWKISLDIFNYQ